MAAVKLENIRMVLIEPNREVRMVLRSALVSAGFRQIVDSGKVDPLAEAVGKGEVDLCVADINSPGGDVCEMIRRLRHHEVGTNPFVLAITTVEAPTAEVVRRAFDAGVDDLIAKPLTPKQILDRVQYLARGRKPFVVTHNYIGPDRRKETRQGPTAKLIDVPNPLALTNHADTSRLQEIIDAAAAQLNEEKMERHSVQIHFLLEQLSPLLEGRSRDRAVIDLLDQMLYAAEDLGRRLRGTRFGHVAELAMTLIGLVMRLRRNPFQPEHKDVDVLPKLCMAIERAFIPDERAAEVALEISQTLDKMARDRSRRLDAGR